MDYCNGHNPDYKSMGKNFQHSRANNSKVNNLIWPKFFYACPRYLQVWQTSYQRWLRKARDIICFHNSWACNSKVTGQIWPEFEPIQHFMSLLPVSLMKIEFIVTDKEDHWSCITHLSAGDILKSAVIEEKKFKHSPRVGADPLGPKYLCQQEASSLWSFVASLMKLGSKYELLDTPAIWNANKFTEVIVCKVLKWSNGSSKRSWFHTLCSIKPLFSQSSCPSWLC